MTWFHSNEGMLVHGDIRHLETIHWYCQMHHSVHGDIRHLEKDDTDLVVICGVHGDIRHLENNLISLIY